jgi:hypothetical protein
MPNLPHPTIHPDILTAPTTDDLDPRTQREAFEFLLTMHVAMTSALEEESAVNDFAVMLLRALDYTYVGKILRTRKTLPLVICGEYRQAKTDVCLVDNRHQILLLVQEDKRHLDEADPEPQLIAEAIAAVTANNRMHQQNVHLQPLPSKLMAGITMKGTAPIFYKINVTQELVACVAGGTYPQTETVVYAHIPGVPRPDHLWVDGMKPLDNRRIILSCYEAFKKFVH